MEYGWNEEFKSFREEVRAFIREVKTPALMAEVAAGGRGAGPTPELDAMHDAIEARGWVKMCWPVEIGGEGKSPWFRYILGEELSLADIPYGGGTSGMIGPAIERFGTDEQKAKYLPDIWSGRMTLALGYSEPNAGTDLASLETMATRDGDDWVVNGQKLWTSGAHVDTHIWLAARTDPDAPKHRGISMFIVPLTAQGVTVRPIWTMSGYRTNEVFFEDVRIPGDALIGEPGRGWYILANALDFERVVLGDGATLVPPFHRLVSDIRERRPELLADKAVRTRLCDLELDLEVMRALNLTNASIVATGETPTMEASMSKVWTTELRYRLGSTGMDLLGREGALSDEPGPIGGEMDRLYRISPFLRFGGGTNEVMRNIIAQRGLGLPR